MAAWRAGGEIVPLKPWLWMSEWVFREHALAGSYGPVALAAVVTVIVVMVCGPWARGLGPELRAWCLAYPAYLGLVSTRSPASSATCCRCSRCSSSSSAGLGPTGGFPASSGPARPCWWRGCRRAGGVGLPPARVRAPLGLPAVMSDLLTAERRSELAGRALRRPVLFLLVTYGLSRVAVLVAMLVAATWFQTPAGVGHLEPTVGDIFRLWDSKWYAEIAQGGYPLPLPVDPDTSRLTYSAWAFYPGSRWWCGRSWSPACRSRSRRSGSTSCSAPSRVLVWQAFRFALHAAPQPAVSGSRWSPRRCGASTRHRRPDDALHRGARLRAGRDGPASAHAAPLRRRRWGDRLVLGFTRGRGRTRAGRCRRWHTW